MHFCGLNKVNTKSKDFAKAIFSRHYLSKKKTFDSGIIKQFRSNETPVLRQIWHSNIQPRLADPENNDRHQF